MHAHFLIRRKNVSCLVLSDRTRIHRLVGHRVQATTRLINSPPKMIGGGTQTTGMRERSRLHARLSRGLEGARLSLTTTGTFADSEVIQMLEELNAELQHTSTLMTDHVVNVFKLDRDLMTLGPEQQATVNRTSESIGSTLMQSFLTARPDGISVYLQIPFQAYLTCYLCWIVPSWTLDRAQNASINEIYQRMRKTGRKSTFECRHLTVH